MTSARPVFLLRTIKSIKIIGAVLLLSLAVGLAAPAHAGAAIVVNTASDAVSATDNQCSLREAIAAANADTASGDTGTFPNECAAGSGADTITFAGNYTITLGSQLPAITTTVTITGGGASNTVVQANAAANTAAYRVLEVGSGGNLTLASLTVRNGRCAGLCSTNPSVGGGILNGGTLTLNSVIVSGNSAQDEGGGVLNEGAIPAISGSIFSANSAANSGGGIANDFNSTITTIDNSALSGNSAATGGGIYNTASSTISTISSSTFSANSASDSGGGIYNSFTSTIGTISNSTFSGNTAQFNGGGIYLVHNSTITAIGNSTFSGNRATGVNGIGGGIYSNTGVSAISAISSTIAAGNTAPLLGGNCAGNAPASSTANLSDSAGCYSTGWTNTLVPGTGYDTTLRDNGCVTALPDGSCVMTFALLAGSPAVDASVGGTAADERGFAAVGPRDVGAYESAVGLGAPTGLTATPVSVTRIDLAWTDAASTETGYKVERSPAGAGTWSLLATTGANAVTYSDTTAVCGTGYDYRVTATNASGSSAASNVANATTPACAPPPVLTSPKNGALAYKPPRLAWKAIRGAPGYHVEVLDSLNSVVQSGDTARPVFQTTPLPFGVYSWHVAVKGPSGLGQYSAPFSFEVTLNKTPKKNAILKNGVVKFTWLGVKGKTYLLRITDETAHSVFYQTPSPLSKPTFTVDKASPLPAGSYSWQVSIDGGSSWTPAWTFTVN